MNQAKARRERDRKNLRKFIPEGPPVTLEEAMAAFGDHQTGVEMTQDEFDPNDSGVDWLPMAIKASKVSKTVHYFKDGTDKTYCGKGFKTFVDGTENKVCTECGKHVPKALADDVAA